ncbi:hypothetical protein D3C76_1723840 [compost metagenome]
MRIGQALSRSNLQSVSFRNPDGTLAVIVMNESDEPQTFTLGYGGELAEASLPARSIATYVLGN